MASARDGSSDTRDGVEIESTGSDAAAYDERLHDTLVSDAGLPPLAVLVLGTGERRRRDFRNQMVAL